uniref:Uncharacterized protein n=1 Tax=Glossina pallidipes TaxID=7398 RepID=A0A1A9ZK57_GLOPL
MASLVQIYYQFFTKEIKDPNIEATINVNLLGLINTTVIALPYKAKTQHARAICPDITLITLMPMVLELPDCDTFAYTKPLIDEFFKGDIQSASKCGEHLVEIIEMSQNGRHWISDQKARTLNTQQLKKISKLISVVLIKAPAAIDINNWIRINESEGATSVEC